MHRIPAPFSYYPHEHMARIDRWYRRLCAIPVQDSLDYVDHAIVVLLHCFGMRDWLRECGVSQTDLDSLFGSEELKLCRDIANGTKHLNVNRPSVDPNHEVRRRYVPWRRLGEPETEVIVCAFDGQRFGSVLLHDLCKRCVEQIHAFVDNLPTPPEVTGW